MTVKQILEHAHANDLANTQASEMEQSMSTTTNATVNYTARRKPNSGRPKVDKHGNLNRQRSQHSEQSSAVQSSHKSKQNASNSKPNAKTCYHCGGAWPHAQQCPAMGKRCNICNKRNHYARCCQQAKVHTLQNTSQSNVYKLSCSASASASPGPSEVTSDDDDFDYVFGLGNKSKLPSVDVFLGQHTVHTYIDSCASVNMINQDVYNKWAHKPTLRNPTKKIFPYGSKEPLPVIGMFTTEFSYGSSTVSGDVYVSVDGDSLLSFDTAQALGLIQITYSVDSKPPVDEIVNKFSDRFDGIGKLAGVEAKLHINDDINYAGCSTTPPYTLPSTQASRARGCQTSETGHHRTCHR